jgi:murein DD-endopeptidase MepM/ murein hydrolase activator NlpD
MSAEPQPRKNRGLLIALVTGVFALVAVGAAALLVNISERKSEARHAFVKVVEVTENDTDPAKWGKNWPREYDDYQRTAERTGTKYGGGIMTWPAPGYYTITSPFGWRIHPITHDKRYHTGNAISGAGINKTKAIAAADGTVIMAQRYGGYGNAVIIDHGGGITTLYGHGSSLKVSVGQKVKKGDTVLLIGSTGNSTGPHLHFAVGRNIDDQGAGDVAPSDWLAGAAVGNREVGNLAVAGLLLVGALLLLDWIGG